MSAESPNEFIRGPKWRMRATPQQRHRAALVTFVVVVAVGVALLTAVMWGLAALGAPPSIVVLPWLVPTAAVLLWTVLRGTPARLSDDDDDTWFGYAIRWALVGEAERRPVAVRVVVALLVGAPVGWALLVVAALIVLGII